MTNQRIGKPTLNDAIALAISEHRGQRDKIGKPYIFHPLRVMQHMDTDKEKIVAVLHDVVEDTSITLDDLLSKGYSNEIVDAIDCLSKRGSEEYFDYIERVKKSPMAIQVKLADLQDNMDPNRIPDESEQAKKERLAVYKKAYKILMAEINRIKP